MQALPERLLNTGAAGIVELLGGAMGVLCPFNHPDSKEVQLRLVVVPMVQGTR
jgi:hypothetical protein